MDTLRDPQLWASLLTLTAMEIVLGIDNIVFIAILADRLPKQRRSIARRIGLLAALVTRLVLLFSITWIMRLTEPIFDGWAWLSWRDVILIGGGFFLVYKGTAEIHARIEGGHAASTERSRASAGLLGVIAQIGVLDVVFSLDSVITAVGMANDLWVMVTAVVAAVAIMLAGATAIAEFIGRYPTVKMLALSFLLLIGMTLIADGFGAHVRKGYIYAAMAFSALVELLNQLAGRRRRGHGAGAEGGTVAVTPIRRPPRPPPDPPPRARPPDGSAAPPSPPASHRASR
jgi:predicted tellurium resistance membrane protein TerC